MAAEPSELLKAGDPAGALAALQEKVRASPGDARLRIFLFQLLCVLGDWKRRDGSFSKQRARMPLSRCGRVGLRLETSGGESRMIAEMSAAEVLP